MSESRPSRGGGKRNYAGDGDSDSDQSEVNITKPPASRRTKRQRSDLNTQDEDEDEDMADDEDGTSRTTPYEAGQIMKVYVENFMCHRKFHIDLGRHLNFISGRNGSGKSAIAAAIQLCLGSSARQTGRGSNLGKYIREGSENPAILEITLLNEGPDAFKPDDYGKRIIVQRTIAKSGSTYRLLSRDRKVVSTLRSELDKMLKDFNIYVDTPCCILTQEESKRLIHGSAKEKYEFFIKATGLKLLFEEFIAGEKDVAECAANIDRAKPQLQQLKMDFTAARDKAKEFEALDHIDEKIRFTSAQLFWDQVRSEEAVVEGLNNTLEKIKGRVQTAQDDLDNAAELDGAQKDAQIKQLTSAVDGVSRELAEVVEQKRRKEQEGSHITKQIGRSRVQLDSIEQSRNDHKKRLKEFTADLKEERERLMHDADKAQREIMTEIAACEEEIAAVRQESANLDQHRKSLQDEQAIMQKDLKRVGEQTVRDQSELKKIESELRAAQQSGGDLVTKFGGPKVADLLNRIQQSKHLFQGPVIGPIGSRLSIREGCEKWSMALEAALYSSLRSFIVTTVDDRNRLFNMMKTFQLERSTTIITQAQGARFPTNIPSMDGALSMVDALNIDDDLVFNCLLDQINMDRVAFVETEKEITSRFVEHVNGEDRLKFGLNRILSAKAVTVSYRQGNESSDFHRPAFTNALSTDATAYIASLQQRLQVAQREFADGQIAQRDLNQRLTANAGEIRRLDDAARNIQRKLRELDKNKRELDTRLQDAQEAGKVDNTGHLEAEIETIKGNLDTLDFQYDQELANQQVLEADLKVCKTEIGHMEKARRELAEQNDAHAKALTDFLTKCNSNENKVANLKAALEGKKKQLEEFMTGRYEPQVALRDEALRVARENTAQLIEDWRGEPIELSAKDSKASLERKIKQLQAELAEGKRKANLEGYTAAILADRVNTAKAAYQQKKEEFTIIQNNKLSMEEHVQESKERWEINFLKIRKLTRRFFNEYAGIQGASGTVEIDPSKEEMSLIVQMDASDKKTLATDVRNLSGGERSYITLCLLLALGHVTESPFRLMDEYDVFMDEARRNDTLNSIQKHARRPDQNGRQIIVITPNSLANVKTSSIVKIHRMLDPVKQSAHGLQQQTL